jgi:hypothetical protein
MAEICSRPPRAAAGAMTPRTSSPHAPTGDARANWAPPLMRLAFSQVSLEYHWKKREASPETAWPEGIRAENPME